MGQMYKQNSEVWSPSLKGILYFYLLNLATLLSGKAPVMVSTTQETSDCSIFLFIN